MKFSIIDTIGSVDDLIEKYRKINQLLHEIGSKKFEVNDDRYTNVLEHISFNKGIEVGSKKYLDFKTESSIPFYRVGDMIQKEKVVHITYDDSYPKLLHDDIVVSFDGAIGRVGIGLCGVYSSGLRKIVIHAKTISKGYIYFWANSIKTQNTIQEHATGTTILHAGSSIDYLEINPLPENDLNIELDVIFKSLLSNLKIIDSLNHLKTYLLDKYFS